MLQCLIPYHGGTVTFRGNKKMANHRNKQDRYVPYPSIDNVLSIEGMKLNLLSISQLRDSGYDVSL